MTKAELIARVACRKHLARDLTKKTVTLIIDAAFTELGDHFIRTRASRMPSRLTYPGFGTFTKRRRGARVVRNPQNGAPITIPAQVTLTFAPSLELKKMLNQAPRLGRTSG